MLALISAMISVPSIANIVLWLICFYLGDSWPEYEGLLLYYLVVSGLNGLAFVAAIIWLGDKHVAQKWYVKVALLVTIFSLGLSFLGFTWIVRFGFV